MYTSKQDRLIKNLHNVKIYILKVSHVDRCMQWEEELLGSRARTQ